MTLRPIQSITFAGALFIAFSFTACVEKQQESAGTAQEQHEGMNQTGMTAQTQVAAPDYAAAGEPIRQQVAQLLSDYLKLKDALIVADPQVAKTQAQAILTAAGNIDVAALTAEHQPFATEKLEKVKQSAAEIAGAANVEIQREHLEPLSEATFALTKAFDATDQKLYYQHCPMANNNQGAYWLSSNQAIQNPYMGEGMLKCGITAEVFN